MQLLLVFLLVVEEALYSSSPLCDGVRFVLILHCKEERRITLCTSTHTGVSVILHYEEETRST